MFVSACVSYKQKVCIACLSNTLQTNQQKKTPAAFERKRNYCRQCARARAAIGSRLAPCAVYFLRSPGHPPRYDRLRVHLCPAVQYFVEHRMRTLAVACRTLAARQTRCKNAALSSVLNVVLNVFGQSVFVTACDVHLCHFIVQHIEYSTKIMVFCRSIPPQALSSSHIY